MSGFRALLIALVIVLAAYAGGLLTVNPPQDKKTSVPVIKEEIKESESASTTPTKDTGHSTSTKETPLSVVKKSSETPTVGETIVLVKKDLPAPPPPPVDFEKINEYARDALVNIICVPKSGGLDSVSGSGIIIDKKGVILTNAHIAQYFLLSDFLACIIRTGSPATARYEAVLLYIPNKWIEENASNIVAENPQGTGESDYAFLLISKALNGGVLPQEFPFLLLEEADVQKSNQALVAGYPAGFLGGLTIFNNLYAISSVVTIRDVFTFVTDTIDIFSVGGNLLAQKGASGGAIVNKDSKVVGIVTTATSEAQTADRDLRAVSSSYILRNFFEYKNISLNKFLEKDLLAEVSLFKEGEFPHLSSLLENEILK